MSLSESRIRSELESTLSVDDLLIVSMDKFKQFQQDFSHWGTGLLVGSHSWLIDQLAQHISGLHANSLDCVRSPELSAERIDLRNSFYKIRAFLPSGRTVRFYLGRVGDDRYALFGYQITHSDAEPGVFSENPVVISHAEVEENRSVRQVTPRPVKIERSQVSHDRNEPAKRVVASCPNCRIDAEVPAAQPGHTVKTQASDDLGQIHSLA